MTDQFDKEQHAKEVEACAREVEADRIKRARDDWGVLWGAWKQERLNCGACKCELVPQSKSALFQSNEAPFDLETLTVRAAHVFDLRHRGKLNIPEWVNEDTELWRSPNNSWPDLEIHEIVMRGSATGVSGSIYGTCNRVCDSGSHVFIRPCQSCGARDPLKFRPELKQKGLSFVQPPHSFLDVLREDRESQKRREKESQEYLEQLVKKHTEKKLPDSDELDKVEDADCPMCGRNEESNSKFCGGCGSRFWGRE